MTDDTTPAAPRPGAEPYVLVLWLEKAHPDLREAMVMSARASHAEWDAEQRDLGEDEPSPELRSAVDEAHTRFCDLLRVLHVKLTPPPPVITEAMVEAAAQELWFTELGERSNGNDSTDDDDQLTWDECGESITGPFIDAARVALDAVFAQMEATATEGSDGT